MAGAAYAGADEQARGPLGPGVPTSADLISAIEDSPVLSIAAIETDASAAEGVDLHGTGRNQAIGVLQGVFGEHLQAPDAVFKDIEARNLRAANAAVVSGGNESTSVPPVVAPSGEGQDLEEIPAAAGVEKTRLRKAGNPPEKVTESRRPRDNNAEPSHAALLETSVPVGLPGQSRDLRAVELDLNRTAHGIEPAAPLVRVEAPEELGEGIMLPEIGVRVYLESSSPRRVPSIISEGKVAAYPNVAEDTDLAVVPTPTGFETFLQLRTAQSPRSLVFPVAKPDGAELVADETGGAAVVQGPETLVGISPPTAIDASGAIVPVDLEVVGDSLRITAHPSDSARYPVLIDPLFQTYEWENLPSYQSGICSSSFEWHSFNQCNNREEWGYEQYEQGGFPLDIRVTNQFWGLAPLYVAQGTPGLFIETSNTLTAGDRGTILYSVPRYFTDQSQVGQPPTSYIRRMTLSKLLWQAYSSGPSPYLFAGLWDPVKPGWVSYYTHTGEAGHGVSDLAWQYKFVNGQESGGGELSNSNSNVKIGEVSVQATETRSGSNTDVYVGYASVELGDDLPPQSPVVSGQPEWVDQTAPPVSFTASDSGLGVFAVKASPEGSEGEGPSWSASYGCIGVAGAPCPRTWSSGSEGHEELTYDPSQLPTGVNYLDVVAEDPVGNVSSSSSVQARVDHSAPEVSLAGTLTEQETLGRKRPSYTLRVDAVDGSPEAPQSGVVKTVIKVDGVVVDEYEPGCATQSCGVSREWTLQSEDYSEGFHWATVIATDAVGRSQSKPRFFWLEPSPPTLELSGTLTEQDEIGTSRPRYGLHVDAEAIAGLGETPAEEASFQSTFGTAGTGNGQFNHPAGIAVDASGDLWVVDENNDRVQKFNADGEYLSSFGSSGSGDGQFGRPTDIAIDSSGNLLVTDAGNKRVEKFSPSGEFLMKFGSAGAGDGQLSAAETIAIDSSGKIWIGDTYNGRLQKFNAAGEFLQVIGSRGSGEGQMIEPVGIDFGTSGDVWVADWGNQRVSVFSPSGEFIRQFGSPGSGDGQFARPDTIEVDSKGNVWVGDQNNDRIQQFNESGEYVAQFGSTGSGDEQFNFGWPMGIASDARGNLWISDTGNHRVQQWNLPGGGPAYQSSFGSSGTGDGQFDHPAGVAVDASGNLWVVDENNDRLQKFNADGEYLAQLGSTGSESGQFSAPTGVTIASNGDLWIADTDNHRVQRFSPDGQFLGGFGSFGLGDGKMLIPNDVAIAADGTVWVSDVLKVQRFTPNGEFIERVGQGQIAVPRSLDINQAGEVLVAEQSNDRISAYDEEGNFLRSFGTSGTGPGQLRAPNGVEADDKGNVWVIDGEDRIQQFNENGEYVAQFGSTGAGDGELSFGWPMGMASDFRGNLWISDTGNHRVQRWAVHRSRSQIFVSTKVDGMTLGSASSQCDSEYCAQTQSLTIDASDLAEGSHSLEVTAADGLENTSSATRTFAINADVAGPDLTLTGSLAAAPEGWVEQHPYALHVEAQDPGYGVTFVAVAIDGDEIANNNQTCEEGGCGDSLSISVDAAEYEGGAHTVTVEAEDGAGNERIEAWTMNVDPQGNVSTEEATATLEALAETAEVNPVGPSQEEAETLGSAPGLELEEVDEGLVATGTAVPTAIGDQVADGVGMEVLPDEYLAEPCGEEFTDPDEEAEVALEEEFEPEEPEELAEGCQLEETEGASELEPITVEPLETDGDASEIESVDGASAVAANTGEHVDTVIRPLYEGALTFSAIRDADAPEEFSWTVSLAPGQELKLVDDQHAVVYYESGHPAFSIFAEAAHDAVGTEIPTRLRVSGDDVVTAVVDHRQASTVYPVLSGTGWRGGFTSTEIVGPKDEQELQEERERILEEEREAREAEEAAEAGEEVTVPHVLQADRYVGIGVKGQGPPVPAGRIGANGTEVPEIIIAKKFKFTECFYDIGTGDLPVPNYRELISEATRKCRANIGWVRLKAGLSVHGWFRIDKILDAVWIKKGNLHCKKWGRERPAKVHCKKDPSGIAYWPDKIHLQGDYRFYPGYGPAFAQPPPGSAGTSSCVSVRGTIQYGSGADQQEPAIRPARQGDPCPWP